MAEKEEMLVNDFDSYLVNEVNIEPTEVYGMHPSEKIDAYLKHNNISNITSKDIISITSEAFGVKLTDMSNKECVESIQESDAERYIEDTRYLPF